MKIGIISDSHDAHQNVLKAIEVFNEQKVDYILHAGDMVSPFTAKAFAEVKNAKFIAVFGNCDGEKVFLKSTIESFGGEVYEDSYTGQIGGREIFMTHRPSALDEVAGSGKYDLVVYGHTHKQDIRRVGGTLIINPGESTDWLTGSSAVVVLDADNMSAEVISLK
jgi:putative phosphoesterase